jgi:hypothetical protein
MAAAAVPSKANDGKKDQQGQTKYCLRLQNVKIGERDASGKRLLASVIKEIDPWITKEIRPQWEQECNRLLEDLPYVPPEWRFECWGRLEAICNELLERPSKAFPKAAKSSHANATVISVIMKDLPRSAP